MYANGSNTLTIGGTAEITGNTKADSTTIQNLYLVGGKTITLDNPTTAKIGIASQTVPTESEPVEICGANDTDYSSIFVADDSDNYVVKYNSDKKIVLGVKKHRWSYSANNAALTATCDKWCGEEAAHTVTLTLTASSANYSGWYATLPH